MEANTPLVSIITGYYNRKENLEQCIQSVLDQTYGNFEYIIFDDCSTDGTSELIAKFSDPRLRVIRHEKNMGFTRGIISAIGQSNGDLIAIHGAGDVSFPERIAKQVALLLSDDEIGIVGCLLEDVSNEGTVIHSPVYGDHTSHFTQGEVMYRKSLYYQIGGYNSIFTYGQFTNLKLEMLKISRPDYVNEVLYRRIHFENGVTKNPLKRIEQKFYMELGVRLAQEGNIIKIDTSKVYVKACLTYFSLLKENTPQYDLFMFHLKNNSRAFRIFKIYKFSLLPKETMLNLLKKIYR
jgi:glycosyltransferase involved in cell wall biosynthesis